jgi:hypothetical protein
VLAFRDGVAMTPGRLKGLAALALGGLVASLALSEVPLALSTALVMAAALLGWLRARASWAPNPSWLRIGFALSLVGALLAAVLGGRFPPPEPVGAYTKDADALLQNLPLLRGAAVLTDDDTIYSVIIKDAAFFRRATALQDFNVRPAERRAQVLRQADFVVVSKGKHGWNYLRYDPEKLGKRDAFRAAVSRILKHDRPVEIYGSRLVPVKNDRRFLVLKVEHQS